MSYDLFFRYRPGAPRAPLDELRAWFEDRGFYTLQGEARTQAWYECEDTGVYFAFDLRTDGDAEGSVGALAPVAFNLNYFRPHTFALEAEEELTDFVDEFDLLVRDPQADGMGDGEYSPEGFLRGWNAGNRFAHRAVARQEGMEPPLSMPAQKIEAIWRWNRIRNVYQSWMADELLPCFVPKIVAVQPAGETTVRSAVIWGQGIAAALPEVDGAIVVPGSREDGVRWLPAPELARILEAHPLQPAGHAFRYRDVEVDLSLAVRVLTWEEAPAAVLRALQAAGEPFRGQGVGWDQVLDEELVGG